MNFYLINSLSLPEPSTVHVTGSTETSPTLEAPGALWESSWNRANITGLHFVFLATCSPPPPVLFLQSFVAEVLRIDRKPLLSNP